MAYRIIYNTGRRIGPDYGKILRIQFLFGFLLLLAVAGVNAHWKEGAGLLREVLLVGGSCLENATAELASSLTAGEAVYQAVAEFCGEIIHGTA